MILSLRTIAASLLAVAVFGGASQFKAPAFAAQQSSAQSQPQQMAQPQRQVITQINVVGNVRIEPATIANYLTIRRGDYFDLNKIDESLKNLLATGIFADVELYQRGTALVVKVVENPIINRIIFEGNKKLDYDDLIEEVRLRPRQFYTRSKVRSDVQRIMELYRSKGRFAAIISPKAVRQEQNRVDLVFEIQEGPKTKVGKINIIGNKLFSDGDLRDLMATTESRWWRIFSSNDTFDPDRMAYDQQQMRQFYLNEGYADFRIVSAVAELTPDRKEFIVTFSVEEGVQYEFGEIEVDSEIRDLSNEFLKAFVWTREGRIYNSEAIERSKEALVDAAGLAGYAFADVRPQVSRNRETRTIALTYRILEAPRTYVERINIKGNVRTLERVIRREFRLQEGDAFNTALEQRSETRLNRLGFFREVEITRVQGSEPDRMDLEVAVEEQATGELQLGLGFSSFEGLVFDSSIAERNFMGRGQTARLALSRSGVRDSVTVSFTEPYLWGRTVSGGADLFYNKSKSNERSRSPFISNNQGGQVRAGLALNETWQIQARHSLSFREVGYTQDYKELLAGLRTQGITDRGRVGFVKVPEYDDLLADLDLNGDGILNDDELNEVLGGDIDAFFSPFSGLESISGLTLAYETRNNFIQPTRGMGFSISTDVAGLGGKVRYLRNRLSLDKYWTPFGGWTFRANAEAGYIMGLGQEVRQQDRFTLGGPKLRGFDTAGVGPRRVQYGILENQPQFEEVNGEQVPILDANGDQVLKDVEVFRPDAFSFGGNAYYLARGELFFPLGDAALELGVRASAFIDVGALWKLDFDVPNCRAPGNPDTGVCIGGNSSGPRAAFGIGFSWQSPFGPFRIDLAKNIRKGEFDETQSLQFNVGTQF